MSTNQNQQLQVAQQEVRRGITAMVPEFKKALPQHIDVDRFTRVVTTAISNNPDLLNADRRTLYASCTMAAQDGLLPDGREAALVVYGGKVQYMPMVAGVLKKMRNSGQIASIDAAVVYEKDEFEFERGDNARLVHKPYLGADDPGKMRLAYCVAKLTNGEVHREVMRRADMEKIRAQSKAKNGPLWTTWEDQAWIKSVLKRASKQLPSSSDLDELIKHDNAAMGFEDDDETPPAPPVDVTPTAAAPAARPRGLQSVVDQAGTTLEGTADEVADPVADTAAPADDIPL